MHAIPKNYHQEIPEPEKKEYYLKRREEYYDEFMEIGKRYDPLINKTLENKDFAVLKKAIDEEQTEFEKLQEKYKDIDFMLK